MVMAQCVGPVKAAALGLLGREGRCARNKGVTVLIGYYDYLRTRPKIVTGQ